jgi:hypothetical protein
LQGLALDSAPDAALQAALGALIEDPQAGGMFGATARCCASSCVATLAGPSSHIDFR